MSKNSPNQVFLGFAEDQLPWLLTNRFFPSKIGGKPAWLELQNIPEVKDVTCEYCNDPCIFLCQLNAASNRPHAFHRIIYVFICLNGKCYLANQSGNIKVLRSQLPLKNDFYSDKPANKDVQSEGIEPLVKICQVCGCRGPMLCGKCKKVSYCGQLHQKVDWKIHKQFCVQDNEVENVPLSEILFPEYEIDIEDEEPLEDGKKESDKEAEARRMKEYENLVKEGKVGVMNDISDKELEDFSESKEDKLFGKFKKNVDGYETQVIRYHRHGQPLWISDHGVLNSGFVPNCEICGSRRTFEFQVMPQMLNELKNYDLDWGIIAVFTCESDCHTNDKYVQEFCYKQDLIKTEESGNEIDMQKLKLNERIQSEINKNGSTSSNGSESTAQQPNKSSSSKNEKSKKHAKSNQKKAFKESDNWD